jgi:hypothetical protein
MPSLGAWLVARHRHHLGHAHLEPTFFVSHLEGVHKDEDVVNRDSDHYQQRHRCEDGERFHPKPAETTI